MDVPIRLAAKEVFKLKLMPRKLGVGQRIAWFEIVAHQGTATVSQKDGDPKKDDPPPVEEDISALTAEGQSTANYLWFATKADVSRDGTTCIEIAAKEQGFQGHYSLIVKYTGLAD
jgi:hypothetical protein